MRKPFSSLRHLADSKEDGQMTICIEVMIWMEPETNRPKCVLLTHANLLPSLDVLTVLRLFIQQVKNASYQENKQVSYQLLTTHSSTSHGIQNTDLTTYSEHN